MVAGMHDLEDVDAHRIGEIRELVRERELDVTVGVAGELRELGGLDVLVCNTGNASGMGIEDTDDDGWLADTDISLFGTVRCIRAALPHLLASPVGGSVVCTGSVNGIRLKAVSAARRSLPPASSLAVSLRNESSPQLT